MVHCSAMREAMKDTGSWVGSRWGRVKQSGITGFFYNPTDRPSTRALTPALGHPPHQPRTSRSSPSLPACSDLDSPSRLDTWGWAGRRQEKNQPLYFNGPVIVRWRWKTILSPLYPPLASSASSEFWGDWIPTRMDLQLQARRHYWSLFYTLQSLAHLCFPLFLCLFRIFSFPFPTLARHNDTLMHSG